VQRNNTTLIPLITGVAYPMDFCWNTPNGNSKMPQLTIANAGPDDTGSYRIIVSDVFHCFDIALIMLEVVPLP
jgi:hypothetical protein